jgi:hypothetical protein
METYIDIFLNADSEKASVVFKKLMEMGLKYSIGEHDFFYDWKKSLTIEEGLAFVDKIQENLKGTGVILKFTTKR